MVNEDLRSKLREKINGKRLERNNHRAMVSYLTTKNDTTEAIKLLQSKHANKNQACSTTNSRRLKRNVRKHTSKIKKLPTDNENSGTKRLTTPPSIVPSTRNHTMSSYVVDPVSMQERPSFARTTK